MAERDQHGASSAGLHGGHRDRLRQRLLREGLDAFEDHQVLELLLFHALPRGDTNPLAHLLLRRYGSLSAVLEADPRDLAVTPGIGSRTAAFLALVPQLARRYRFDRVSRDTVCLTTSEQAMAYVVPLMLGRAEEVFYAVCLDTQCRVIIPALVTTGTVKHADVHPRMVVEEVLRNRASSVILAHNHPQGTARPSSHDHRMTEVLVGVFAPLEIKVLDHVIVAGEDTYSFARDGVLPDPGREDL